MEIDKVSKTIKNSHLEDNDKTNKNQNGNKNHNTSSEGEEDKNNNSDSRSNTEGGLDEKSEKMDADN